MTQSVQTTGSQDKRSLQERLRARLRGTAPRDCALLLDISGSMEAYCGANVKQIDELRKLAGKFLGVRQFYFASDADEIPAGGEIPDPRGGTDLALGLDTVKAAGVKHVIVITDGEPNSKADALRSAGGLKIDCFYVGPDGNAQAKEFLERLASGSGGTYGSASFEFARALEEKVRLCLGPGAAEQKGPIVL